MKLDIETFRILQVLVECGSFAKAAERLHKAQSAVSYQVRKLEQHLGVTLFDRQQYRAELTPQGRVILAEGQKLLGQLSHIEQLAHSYREGWEPKLSLVIDGALPMEPILTALKRMAEHKVPTKIQLTVEFLGGVQHRFERDNAHLMLVKDYQHQLDYQVTPLPDICSVLLVSGVHQLAAMTHISLLQLQQFVELTIEDSSPQPTALDDMQFGGDKVFYLAGFMMKKHALLKGLGFGWMPTFLVNTELDNGTLVPVDYVGGHRHSFTPKLVATAGRPLGRAGQLFTQLIIEEFSRPQTDASAMG